MNKQSRKEKRRIERLNKIGLSLSIIISSILIILLFESSVFSIKKILVIGNNKTLSEDIVIESGIKFNENILKTNMGKAEENIEKLPYVKTAEITRESKNVIKIRIEERKESFSFLLNGKVYICDDDGRVLSKNSSTSVFPIIKGFDFKDIPLGSNIFDENENLQGLKDIIYEANKSDLLRKYIEIRLLKNNEYGLTREGGIKIDFGNGDNIKYKFNFIENAIRQMDSQQKSISLIKLNIDPPVAIP